MARSTVARCYASTGSLWPIVGLHRTHYHPNGNAILIANQYASQSWSFVARNNIGLVLQKSGKNIHSEKCVNVSVGFDDKYKYFFGS